MRDPAVGLFHVKDGLYFQRTAKGGVRIIKTDPTACFDPLGYPDAPAELDVTLDDGSWASVVAHVSALGETGETYRAALAFHGVRGDEVGG